MRFRGRSRARSDASPRVWGSCRGRPCRPAVRRGRSVSLCTARHPHDLRAARRERVGRGLVLGELPLVEGGIAGLLPADARAGCRGEPSQIVNSTTTTSGSNQRTGSGHVRVQSQRFIESFSVMPCCAGRPRPRGQYTSRRSRPAAPPCSRAHSSIPRPSVMPTESPTTRMRSGRGCRRPAVHRAVCATVFTASTLGDDLDFGASGGSTRQRTRGVAERRQHDLGRGRRDGDGEEARDQRPRRRGRDDLEPARGTDAAPGVR